MNIFISWSGDRGLKVATMLRDWLPDIFHGIQPFLSSEDIRKGQRWLTEIGKQLDKNNVGICCLTPESVEAPWLHYEAGALSKSLSSGSLFTILFSGLRPSDVEGPLTQFQHTTFTKEDMLKLVTDINALHVAPEIALDENRLARAFNAFWPELEKNVKAVLASTPNPPKKRSSEDMLAQIFDTTQNLAKTVTGMLQEREVNYQKQLDMTQFLLHNQARQIQELKNAAAQPMADLFNEFFRKDAALHKAIKTSGQSLPENEASETSK